METARDEQQRYEGGAGGKFRKRPFRRSVHTTPYERPLPTPVAFRNLNGGGGGWLSKLVDPAQRLIASGAHRLFSSVFRKRLTQPEPPLSPPETNLEARTTVQESVATDFLGRQKETINQGDGPSYGGASGAELTDLEQVLKQKTFTRSEIDRLTALLHSRTVDLAIEDKGKRPEVVPLKQMVSTDRQAGFPRTPAPGNRMEIQAFPMTPAPENRRENQLVSTPVVSSTVLEGGVTSPTDLVELAKSYMHKKPVSPSMLGFRNQAVVENPAVMYTHNQSSPSRLPFTPIVPRITSGHVEARENGFITPRSRGRSAIYSMARTPYSRVHQTNTSKGVENGAEYGGASSSSQNAQGAQKRRSSVLESDIGSYGAIRRIRQKPNLLSSRGLSIPGSSNPLPPSGSGFGSMATQNPSSSRLKPLSVGESFRNPIKLSSDDGDNASVPSISREMASKIFQQLDKLVSPNDKSSEPKVLDLMDKSPRKLSPSMLRGQALKSLEHVDSSKFFGDVQHNKITDSSPTKIVANAQGSTSQVEEKVKENGPLMLGSASYKYASKVNGSVLPKENGEDSALRKKDADHETSVPASFNSAPQPPPKKRAFQMSAFEDFVDLDEDTMPNGTVSDSLPEGRRKVNFSLADKENCATELVNVEKASASTDIKPVASEITQKTDLVSSTGSVTGEKNTNILFQNAFSPSASVFPSVIPTESIVSPPAFNVGAGDIIVSEKDANTASPTINLGFKSAEELTESPATVVGPSKFSFLPPSDTRPESSSKLSTVADGATDTLPKLPEPDKAENNSIETLPSSSSTSHANPFFYSAPTPNNVSLMNGPSISKSPAPVIFNALPSQSSSGSSNNISSAPTFAFTSTTTTTNGLTSSNPIPSLPARPTFKFESPVPTTTEPPNSKTTSAPVAPVFMFSTPGSNNATPLEPTKMKKDPSFGNLSTPPTQTPSTTSSPFGFTATTTSTSTIQSLGAQPSLAGTGASTFAQNIPVQFSSASSSSTTFGLVGSTTPANSISPFDSSSTSTVTNLGSSSSSISAPSSVIGSTWQQPKSPVFSFTANSSPSTGFSFSATTIAPNSSPSTGFSFVPSSSSSPSITPNSSMSAGFTFSSTAPSATTNSLPSTTGFTIGGATTSSPFMNGTASSGSVPFTFGNQTPGFPFLGNNQASNDQMSMEDSSMAEDTVQSSSPGGASLFGQPQQPLISQAPPAFPFGQTAPAQSPVISNQFQFGSQPNLQNPSPFQATGSLGSNFSMGSGGSGADKSNRKFIKIKHKLRKK